MDEPRELSLEGKTHVDVTKCKIHKLFTATCIYSINILH